MLRWLFAYEKFEKGLDHLRFLVYDCLGCSEAQRAGKGRGRDVSGDTFGDRRRQLSRPLHCHNTYHAEAGMATTFDYLS